MAQFGGEAVELGLFIGIFISDILTKSIEKQIKFKAEKNTTLHLESLLTEEMYYFDLVFFRVSLLLKLFVYQFGPIILRVWQQKMINKREFNKNRLQELKTTQLMEADLLNKVKTQICHGIVPT